MPLSEWEQQQLDQLERDLISNDPHLANALKSPGRRPVLRFVVAGAGLVIGMLVLVLGAVKANVALGVVGFAVMFGAVGWAFAIAPRSGSGPHGIVGPDGDVRTVSPGRRKGATGQTRLMSRLEQRWDRRRERGGR